MIAKLLAVITGEDNQRVVILPGLFEIPDDAPKVVVNFADQAIIRRAHGLHLGDRHGTAKPLPMRKKLRLFDRPQIMRQQGMLLRLNLRRRGAAGWGSLRRIVQRIVGCWSNERRVRSDSSQDSETTAALRPP